MPKVTKLYGREIQATKEMEAQAFWLLRRYTSVTYIQRNHELWRSFLAGLEEAARSAPDEMSDWFIETLGVLFPYQAGFERGLPLLRSGNRTSGYRELIQATDMGSFMFSRRFDAGLQWRNFGLLRDKPAVGLFSWAAAACGLATRTNVSLTSAWSYQSLLMYPEEFGETLLPARSLDPLPAASGPLLRAGQEVPVSGIYIPMDLPTGCPNYLIQGFIAPEATVPVKRVEWAAVSGGKYPNGQEYPPQPAHGAFEFGTRVTRWHLVWEDQRYTGGNIPDESEYLLADAALPPYPPQRDPAEPWAKL